MSNLINNLNRELSDKISLSSLRDKKLVFGSGNINAEILLIGEAPGKDEVLQGKPFVGKAGKNLEEFLNILNLKREDIYITNTVKIRPTKLSPKTGREVNRAPESQEIELFRPFLMKEIEIIKPKVIVTLGNVPLKTVLDDKSAQIGDLHGKAVVKDALTLFPLYHPAAVIYNQSLKATYSDDLLKLKAYISEI